jgi:hypothetical protein
MTLKFNLLDLLRRWAWPILLYLALLSLCLSASGCANLEISTTHWGPDGKPVVNHYHYTRGLSDLHLGEMTASRDPQTGAVTIQITDLSGQERATRAIEQLSQAVEKILPAALASLSPIPKLPLPAPSVDPAAVAPP